MSKKRKRPVPVQAPKAERPMVIDLNKVNLAKARTEVPFKTGGYKTEKDRPRKKYSPRDITKEE